MHTVVFFVLIVILIVCSCRHQPLQEPYANTTIAGITESLVKREIEQIKQYQQMFGFHNECQVGAIGADQKSSKTCSRPVADASWKSSSKHVKECFSELLPLLEATRCDVEGKDETKDDNAKKKNTKQEQNKDQLKKMKGNDQVKGLLNKDMGMR